MALVSVSPCPASLSGSKRYRNIPMNTTENIKLSYEQYPDDLKRNITYEGSGVRISNKISLLCYRQIPFH